MVKDPGKPFSDLCRAMRPNFSLKISTIKKIQAKFILSLFIDRDNFSKGADGKLQMKLRPFEIAASNTLVLSEKTDELDKYYKIGQEVIVFGNTKDLKQKIDYFLKHEEERTQIARAAYERTIREHSWNNRFVEIFKTVNEEHR